MVNQDELTYADDESIPMGRVVDALDEWAEVEAVLLAFGVEADVVEQYRSSDYE